MSESQITDLSDAHKKLLLEVRQRWQEAALSTQPADRARAEHGIAGAYHSAGLKMPKVIWCQSPLAMALIVCFLTQLNENESEALLLTEFWQAVKTAGDGVVRGIHSAVGLTRDDGVLSAFEHSLHGLQGERPNLDWNLGSSNYRKIVVMLQRDVWRNIYPLINEELRNEISRCISGDSGTMISVAQFQPWSPVWTAILAAIGQTLQRLEPWSRETRQDVQQITQEQARRLFLNRQAFTNVSLSPEPSTACRNFIAAVWRFVQPERHRADLDGLGMHRVASLAIWDFCKEAFGMDVETKPIQGLISLAESAGWCIPFPQYCFVCERPTMLNLDEEGRLHSENGPAVSYMDGWSIYSWHGVAVPKHVIVDPHGITVTEIQNEENIEVRRVMLERFGMGRFLQESGAKEIHRDDCGVLYRKARFDEEALVVVRVTNKTAEADGTFREYFLRVPPNITTAKDAVAWTFGLTGSDYDPALET